MVDISKGGPADNPQRRGSAPQFPRIGQTASLQAPGGTPIRPAGVSNEIEGFMNALGVAGNQVAQFIARERAEGDRYKATMEAEAVSDYQHDGPIGQTMLNDQLLKDPNSLPLDPNEATAFGDNWVEQQMSKYSSMSPAYQDKMRSLWRADAAKTTARHWGARGAQAIEDTIVKMSNAVASDQDLPVADLMREAGEITGKPVITLQNSLLMPALEQIAAIGDKKSQARFDEIAATMDPVFRARVDAARDAYANNQRKILREAQAEWQENEMPLIEISADADANGKAVRAIVDSKGFDENYVRSRLSIYNMEQAAISFPPNREKFEAARALGGGLTEQAAIRLESNLRGGEQKLEGDRLAQLSDSLDRIVGRYQTDPDFTPEAFVQESYDAINEAERNGLDPGEANARRDNVQSRVRSSVSARADALYEAGKQIEIASMNAYLDGRRKNMKDAPTRANLWSDIKDHTQRMPGTDREFTYTKEQQQRYLWDQIKADAESVANQKADPNNPAEWWSQYGLIYSQQLGEIGAPWPPEEKDRIRATPDLVSGWSMTTPSFPASELPPLPPAIAANIAMYQGVKDALGPKAQELVGDKAEFFEVYTHWAKESKSTDPRVVLQAASNAIHGGHRISAKDASGLFQEHLDGFVNNRRWAFLRSDDTDQPRRTVLNVPYLEGKAIDYIQKEVIGGLPVETAVKNAKEWVDTHMVMIPAGWDTDYDVELETSPYRHSYVIDYEELGLSGPPSKLTAQAIGDIHFSLVQQFLGRPENQHLAADKDLLESIHLQPVGNGYLTLVNGDGEVVGRIAERLSIEDFARRVARQETELRNWNKLHPTIPGKLAPIKPPTSVLDTTRPNTATRQGP